MFDKRDLRLAPRRAIALVLAGGRGSRLKQLTDRRAKPATYFGGKFRIIDFALSNCINSGFRRIGVLTQYKSHSLLRHLQRGWGFFRGEMNEFCDLLPAQQRISETAWYQGTADAIYQNLDILRGHDPEYILILAGDHIYKMDYGALLLDHIDKGADVTVPCIEVPRELATGFGVMHIDESRRVIDFVEKPADPPAIPGKPDKALASMGIYVFNAQFLYEQLERDANLPGSSRDFGKDIIPYLVSRAKVVAHDFRDSAIIDGPGPEPYWRDVGTIDAYWEANLDLTHVTPQLNMYDKEWPIFTYQEQLPPAKFVFDDDHRRGMAVDSLVSGGCIVSGSTVRRSLLFSSVRVNSYSLLEEAVVLPDCEIGRRCRLRKVVIDRGVEIPEGLVVGEDPELDAKRFHRSEGGVCLITRDMIDRLQD
ncbi:glucose-1-phosphate adenylyltransferase [Azospirillum sp. RWY-5-1]|uniref:Glucose-1-phosphate adenylyltransferase n=1 Tax=Azospirillum oleiclasticum TaxID=2735135 RepID=A0ABX2T7W0_9PROT|nr:glucose-1-phosphate adenylyltransferase [Azospirillum oleiclasticum]NYZ12931.1 glucose-1-phosphate adenylyltransferase [Azospirillum oleiclasticum]NYZ20396.1 glucose-1-phosphate adenylyltransferase [Azospirillum oleiclasticum]